MTDTNYKDKARHWIKYIEILRPTSCIFGALIVLLGYIFTLGARDFGIYLQTPKNLLKLGISMMIYFLVVGSGNTINDVVDYEIDKVNRPRRTIVRGAFSRLGATYYYIYILLAIMGLTVIAASMSPNPSIIPLIVIFFLFISFTYSHLIKKTGFLANLTVAIAGALGFPFGALFLVDIREMWKLSDIWILYSIAFFFLLSREIVKDIEDIEGDRQFNIRSIALKWGLTPAKIILLLLIGGLMIIFGFSMPRYNYPVVFIIFIFLSILSITVGFWALTKNIEEKKWRILASRLYLVGQLLAILAYFFAIII